MQRAHTSKNPDTEAYTVTVNKKMMQDYRVGASTDPIGMLAAAWPTDGKLILYNMTTDGRLLRLRRDPASLTGWAQDQLPLPSGVPTGVAAAPFSWAVWTYVDATGAPHLIVGAPGNYMVDNMEHPFGTFDSVLDEDGLPTNFVPLGFSPLNQTGCTTAANASFFAYWCPGEISPPGSGWLGGFTGAGSSTINLPLLLGVEPSQYLALPNGPVKLAALPLLNTQLPTQLPAVVVGPSPLTCYGLSALEASIWLCANYSTTTLPTPFSLTDFALLAAPDGDSLQIIGVDGTNQIHSLTGISGPDGQISWASAWSSIIPAGSANLAFSEVKAWWSSDGNVQLMVKDAGGLLRNILQGGALQWSTVPITGRPVSQWMLIEEQGQRGFVFVDADGRLDVRLLDSGGVYRREIIEIDGDADVTETTTYRAGVTITTSDKVGVSGQPVSVSSSDEIEVTINGSPSIVGPGNSAVATTDGTGSIWLTTTLGDSLYAPVFTFTSALLKNGQLELRPDADTHAYLSGVTAGDLVGQNVLNPEHDNQKDATEVVNALKQVVGIAAAAYNRPDDGPAGSVILVSQPGVRWGALQQRAAADLIAPQGPAGQAWRFSARSGKPRFELMTAANAATLLSERIAVGCAHVRAPLGFNPFSSDDWENAFDSVASALSSVVDIVYDGLKAAVTFMVNGLEFVVDAVIDGAAKVFDLVTAIFDAVGTALGTVVGWILDQIGFLFGWDDIKRQRDNFKAWAQHLINAIPQNFPSPATGAASYTNFLTQAKSDIDTWIADTRKTPVGSQALGTTTAGAPLMTELFNAVSGLSSLSQSTWLIEKVQDALSRFSKPLPQPSIPGMDSALADFESTLARFATSLGAMALNVEPTLESWITNPDSFTNGNIDPFLDFIGANASTLIGALNDIVAGASQVLQLLWDNPQAIYDWLDSTIHLPFLSAFYKAVMKADLSMLEVMCLACGIAAVASGQEIAPPSHDTTFDDRAPDIAVVLLAMSVGCLTTGFASALSASEKSDNPSVRMFTMVDSVFAAFVACAVLNRGGPWRGLAITQAVLAIMTTLFACVSASSKPLAGAATIQAVLNVLWTAKSESSTGHGPDINLLAYSVFEIFQVTGYWLACEGGMKGSSALYYGAFQASMSGLMTYFWKAGNSESTAMGPALMPPEE